MTDNVTILNCQTKLPLPAERILNGAAKQEFQTLLLIGKTKDGEYYFAGTDSDVGVNLFLLEAARHQLLDGAFENDEPVPPSPSAA